MATWECPREWSEWTDWLGAGLHGRCRWRLSIVLFGILFAREPRTVASWLRAAGIGRGFSGYYYFISAVGRKSKSVAARLFLLLVRRLSSGERLLLALDDTPTMRYGPKVQGAGIHHNPTSGPADAKYLHGHIWVTLSWVARHPPWGTIGLPLLGALHVRRKDISAIPKQLRWPFQTKPRQGADLNALPPKLKKGQRRGRGKPRKYGTKRISLATYRPAYGMIRVVIVQEATGPRFFFRADPSASVVEILEAFADRAAIEQDFHDLKVIRGIGRRQLRHPWSNIGAYHLNLWMHSLVELWSWGKSKGEIRDRRDSPRDDPGRRPSRADRRKASRRNIPQLEYLSLARRRRAARKIAAFAQQLVKLAV